MALLTPEQDPASPVQKAAIKTLEGKVALAMTVFGAVVTVLGLLHEQGVFGDGKLAAIIGALVAVSATLGLAGARTALKMNGNNAAALVEAARLSAEAAKAAPPSGPTSPSA
jgi:hypothetical protein